MEPLREIMSDLVGIEYSLEAFCSLLGDLKEIYELKQDESRKKNVWIFQLLLNSLSENLSDSISAIDRFLMDSGKT